MAIKTHFFILFSLFCSLSLCAQYEQLIVVNGGIFGSTTEKANLGVFDPTTGVYTHLDTIYTNSVQDILVEDNRYAYVAAQDSIVKYDLWSGQRLAANAFGASSTIKLGIYQNKLLVGNWYGASSGNLRIFDKNSLSYLSDVPQIEKGAQDFVIIGDYAYVAQNNTSGSWSDTLGYLAIVDLTADTFLRNDTLSTVGDELGRLVNVGDTAIYGINSVSNTLSYYHISSAQGNTYAASAALSPRSYGTAVYAQGGGWLLSFDNGIGRFDLVNNSVLESGIIAAVGSPPFVVSPNNIFISIVDFGNQNNNIGIYYNLTGDSLGTFPVGFSPEVFGVFNNLPLERVSPLHISLEWNLFPNPAVNFIHLQVEQPLQAYRLSDSQGRVLSFETLNNNEDIIQINTTQLSAGQYVVTIWDNEGNSSSKLFGIIR